MIHIIATILNNLAIIFILLGMFCIIKLVRAQHDHIFSISKIVKELLKNENL